jgi:hypothetical protein
MMQFVASRAHNISHKRTHKDQCKNARGIYIYYPTSSSNAWEHLDKITGIENAICIAKNFEKKIIDKIVLLTT